MKAVVLLSGGCDSATCLGLMVEEHGAENVHAVSVSYGQRHAKEIQCAERIASRYGVELHHVDLSNTGIFNSSACSLLSGSKNDVPDGEYSEQLEHGRITTYVPFRNGLIVSAVAALALSIDDTSKWLICLGAHADDSAGDAYADCSPEFVDLIAHAVEVGTYGLVTVVAPFVRSLKEDVVRVGLGLGVPYELTWSCYKGGDVQCGRCGTCMDRKKAFAANGVEDPVPYAE